MPRFEQVLPGQFIDVERVIGIGVSPRVLEGEDQSRPPSGYGVGIIWETTTGVSPILLSPTFETEEEAEEEAERILDLVVHPFQYTEPLRTGVLDPGGYYGGEGYNPGLGTEE